MRRRSDTEPEVGGRRSQVGGRNPARGPPTACGLATDDGPLTTDQTGRYRTRTSWGFYGIHAGFGNGRSKKRSIFDRFHSDRAADRADDRPCLGDGHRALDGAAGRTAIGDSGDGRGHLAG
jgi:hypothetical protein